MDHPANPEYPYKKYFVDHIDFNAPANLTSKVRSSLNILYSLDAKRKIQALLEEVKPDIVHLNNFAHQISPSVLDVFHRLNIPAVMTMRDYKLVCASYSMLSKGKPCELCKQGRYYSCFSERCTKGSTLKSLVNTVEMYLHHRILHIYDKIDIFISPSRFLMEKVMEMGFRGRVVHLPNFVDVEAITPAYQYQEESIVYVGRLSAEKGVGTLIDAVKGLDVRLTIVGDGPLMQELTQKVKGEHIHNVSFLGYKKSDELQDIIRRSMFVILPSECYENNPRVIIEAFALGKPALGARIGGIPELVRDGQTGFMFESGNATDIRNKIVAMLQNRERIAEMGRTARAFIEKDLNPEVHYKRLSEIYRMAMQERSGG